MTDTLLEPAAATPAVPPDHAAAPPPAQARRTRLAYRAVALLHVVALLAGGALIARRWYDTLYHLRDDRRAEWVLAVALLAWPIVLGFVPRSRARARPVRWALLAVTGWIALLGAGATLYELSLMPRPVVTIEGAPLDPAAPPAASVTERTGAPLSFAHEWRRAALPGQTLLWEGYAVRLAKATLAESVSGLPPPAADGAYLIMTLEATGRGDYRAGWPADRTALAVTIDKVRIVPKEGWAMGAPSEPQSPGWVEVDGRWEPYGPNDLHPQLPIPARGETVTRRFAAFVPAVDPYIGRYDHLFVVVHADIEENCWMRPPDIERRCTWLLFAWEVPKPPGA